MERKFVNEVALDIDGTPVETAMKEYMDKKSPATMAAFVQSLTKAKFLVPVEFPKKLNKDLVAKLQRGEKVTPQELPQMLPILLTNKQGDHFVPAYTSKEQLPKEQKYAAIMPVPFKDILRVAHVKEYKAKAICMNPHTNNLILSDKFIQLMDDVYKGETVEAVLEKNGFGKAQTNSVQMTVEQFHGFARRNVEVGTLPKFVFDNKETFLATLEEKGPEMILDMYRSFYRTSLPFEYTTDDIDIMMLAIRDDLTIVSITLPSKNLVPGSCSSAYIVWNPETKDVQYFVIESLKGKETNSLAQITSDGKHTVIADAPAHGSEMSVILEMFE